MIGLSLREFRNAVSDLARPNRFEVLITPPAVYDIYTPEQLSMLSWIAETAQIPARTQGEVPIKFHGMEYKLPGDFAKENLSIGFLNTYGWEGRAFFERWMDYIQEIVGTNRRESAFSLLNDSKIRVTQLGRTRNDELARYEFYDVYPTNISNIELNMSEFDSVEKFTVEFAYSYYEALGSNNG
jgi:hypothetical protein